MLRGMPPSLTAGLRINPRVSRLVDSLTGEAVPHNGFARPMGLSPASGKPVMVDYDMNGVGPDFVNRDKAGMWRFEELLPVQNVPASFGDDVGQTRTVPAPRLGDKLDVELWVKNEGSNPSGSFKDRGLSMGVALGVACGAKRFCLPTQGNAGVASALFSARLGLAPALVYMPDGYQGGMYHRACAYFGGEVRFFGANIAAAGKKMREDLAAELEAGEYVDVSTFFEPGRLEGKKTMGFEIWEHFGTELPDWILYPTGGGTGLVGIWKALGELTRLDALPPDRKPAMVAVQSENCSPVVDSFHGGLDHVEPTTSKGTVADGLDVPGAIMGHQMLGAIRESGGTAVKVGEEAIRRAFADWGRCGFAAGYESGALLAAARAMRHAGTIKPGQRVLIVSTSGPMMGLGNADDA